MVQICPSLISPKRKSTPYGLLFFLSLSNTLDAAFLYPYDLKTLKKVETFVRKFQH